MDAVASGVAPYQVSDGWTDRVEVVAAAVAAPYQVSDGWTDRVQRLGQVVSLEETAGYLSLWSLSESLEELGTSDQDWVEHGQLEELAESWEGGDPTQLHYLSFAISNNLCRRLHWISNF
jgi:hypothetical protein